MSAVCTGQPRTYSKKSHRRYLRREFIRQRIAWANSHSAAVARLQSLCDRVHDNVLCECASSLPKVISILCLIDQRMKIVISMVLTMSEKVDAVRRAQDRLRDLKIEDLESHLFREIEIKDHIESDYNRFVLGRRDKDCRCEACRQDRKYMVQRHCDCDPAGLLVDYTVKRELYDGKCCEACYHISTASGCECFECMREKDLHEMHAVIEKVYSECWDIQKSLHDLEVQVGWP